MNDEQDRLAPEDEAFVAGLRRARAVRPTPATRDRIVAAAAAVAAASTTMPRRRWLGRIAAAGLVAAVGITFLFPPALSSLPGRMVLDGTMLDAGSRTSGLARLAHNLEVVEKEIR